MQQATVNDQVLVKPIEKSDQTDGGVYIPGQSNALATIGEVVMNSSDGVFRKGDHVIYYMENPHDIDGQYKRRTVIDGEEAMIIDQAAIQAKLRQPYMEKLKPGDLLKIDYSQDIEMIGKKVAIEILPAKEKTDSGIILPEFSWGKDMAMGKILALGPKANAMFSTPELKKGDLVMLPTQVSGGNLPLSVGGRQVVRTNAEEVLLVFDEKGEWRPLGARIFIRPIDFIYQKKRVKVDSSVVKGGSKMIEVYQSENSELIIPATATREMRTSEVVKAGRGWSSNHPLAKTYHIEGIDLRPGATVIHTNLKDREGRWKNQVEEVEVDGEKMLVIPVNMIDAVLKVGAQMKVDQYRPEKQEVNQTLMESTVVNRG